MLRRCARYVGIVLCVSLMASMHIAFAMNSGLEFGEQGECKIHASRRGLWSKVTGFGREVVQAAAERELDVLEDPAEYQGSVPDACKLLVKVCGLADERQLCDTAQRAQWCRLRDNAMGALQYALAAGKSVHARDQKGHSGLHVLGEYLDGHAWNCHVISRAILMLLNVPDVRANYACLSRYDTLLHRAAQCGCIELIEPLVRSGIGIDTTGHTDWHSPLADAVAAMHLHCIKQRRDAAAVIELLLELKANPNHKDADGRTPLHWAAESDTFAGDATRLLLAYNADVNARDRRGRTPLIGAVSGERCHNAVIRLLLENKASVLMRDNEQCTARDHALRAGRNAMAEQFRLAEVWERVVAEGLVSMNCFVMRGD